jgi:hypothetical protein
MRSGIDTISLHCQGQSWQQTKAEKKQTQPHYSQKAAQIERLFGIPMQYGTKPQKA